MNRPMYSIELEMIIEHLKTSTSSINSYYEYMFKIKCTVEATCLRGSASVMFFHKRALNPQQTLTTSNPTFLTVLVLLFPPQG